MGWRGNGLQYEELERFLHIASLTLLEVKVQKQMSVLNGMFLCLENAASFVVISSWPRTSANVLGLYFSVHIAEVVSMEKCQRSQYKKVPVL